MIEPESSRLSPLGSEGNLKKGSVRKKGETSTLPPFSQRSKEKRVPKGNSAGGEKKGKNTLEGTRLGEDEKTTDEEGKKKKVRISSANSKQKRWEFVVAENHW